MSYTEATPVHTTYELREIFAMSQDFASATKTAGIIIAADTQTLAPTLARRAWVPAD